MTPELEKQYRETLAVALRSGHAVLARGAGSLDAVEAGIRVLEDSPLFNAGKGSVFTEDGGHQMDAAIMDGRTLKAGAVANVSNIKNPISAARAVMEKSAHVMLAGRGAEQFAERVGIETADASYFHTDRRRREHLGTVGAVALDAAGDLAAGTSTGGTTNKLQGRIGDSPIIGAGTYASNDSVAVSCTGLGEFFIRFAAAHDIAALYRYRGMSVDEAGDEVIMNKLAPAGGWGGAIILDRRGNFAMPFNSEGMYRGWIGDEGEPHVKIYKE
ncbi:MAG TPA: isoaspartyl peptidase/L-asparaginase [Thermoanaerobaculia bacterium]|nr:isoaspartyl peptidase/L-asparaginase [Thermoanaerobaculia bacterium]